MEIGHYMEWTQDTKELDTQVRVGYKRYNSFPYEITVKIRDACSKEFSLKFVFVTGKRMRPEGEITSEM